MKKKANSKVAAKGLFDSRSMGIIFGVSLLIFIACMVWAMALSAKRERIHNKAIAMGLLNATPEMEERHVGISENPEPPGRYGDVNVHIMCRPDSGVGWQLLGTGTRLGKRPNFILTAYHVFERTHGQYGYREIGPKEFTGQAKLVPIVQVVNSGNADDSVLCQVDENGTDFPAFASPVATNMFHNWEAKGYTCRMWPVDIHFSTYPKKVIKNALTIEVGNGAFHFFFDWHVMQGESGTSALINGERENAYLVIIRSEKIPRKVYNQLPLEVKRRINWKEDKFYGVGNLICFDPKAL